MNENDMERYFWRTGQRWSGEYRSREQLIKGVKLPRKTVILLFLVFLVTSLLLLLLNLNA